VRCSPLASAATGWVIVGPPQNQYFTHGGVDAGFESMMVTYESGDGAIVMTNGVGGGNSVGDGDQSSDVAVTRLTYMANYSIGALRSA
jgi:hypothetical protein